MYAEKLFCTQEPLIDDSDLPCESSFCRYKVNDGYLTSRQRKPVFRRRSARQSCTNTWSEEPMLPLLLKSCISTCGKRRSDVDADKTSVFEVVIDSLELGRFRQASHPIRQVRRRPTYPSHVAQPLALIGHSYLF